MQENFIDHEARKSGLGSSDMPIVLGVSPWTRPEDLFEIKKGRRPEPEESPAMKRGKVLEAVAEALPGAHRPKALAIESDDPPPKL